MRAKSLIFIFILPIVFGFTSDKVLKSVDDTPVALVKRSSKMLLTRKPVYPIGSWLKPGYR